MSCRNLEWAALPIRSKSHGAIFGAFLVIATSGAAFETKQVPSLDDISPTLRFIRKEFYLGEHIPFELGRKTPAPIDAMKLSSGNYVLRIVRPDKTLIEKKEGGATVYDGPSEVSSLSHTESLNDLDPQVTTGKYLLSYEHGSRKATAEIEVRELPLLKNIQAAISFPDHFHVAKDKSLKIGLTVHNRATEAIRIVIPDSNYWASITAYTRCEVPPAAAALVSDRQRIRDPNFRVPISYANAEKLSFATVAPNKTYSLETALHGNDANKTLYPEPQWSPKTRFEIVAGLVLPVFLDGKGAAGTSRPVELLIRAKACYDVQGNKQTAGCDSTIKSWPKAPLD